jgi:hypothetical protein
MGAGGRVFGIGRYCKVLKVLKVLKMWGRGW